MPQLHLFRTLPPAPSTGPRPRQNYACAAKDPDGAVRGALQIRERGPGCFLVVHTGRGDVVLGVMTAIQARGFPMVSGILMTGGGRMDPGVESVMDSLESLDAVPVPVMFVNDDTFVAAHNIVNMRRKLAASGTRKVDSAISLYEKYADRESIYSLVTLSKES